jgi:prepilin-type N-terminal cleavage/methylation domain-containing protein
VIASRPRPARGFTLLEVMIAMGLLLVGGVSILAVFTLAVAHRVERDVEAKLDLVVPEVQSMAQEAVNRVDKTGVPTPIVNAATSQIGFTVSIRFAKSPNYDRAWVALARIAYRGSEFPQGVLKPMFLTRPFYQAPR